jgi:hypothetical protein
MRFRKDDDWAGLGFERLLGKQVRTFLEKGAAEYSSDIRQRMTAADQTDVMWAIADNVAFCTQHSVPQRTAFKTRLGSPEPTTSEPFITEPHQTFTYFIGFHCNLFSASML